MRLTRNHYPYHLVKYFGEINLDFGCLCLNFYFHFHCRPSDNSVSINRCPSANRLAPTELSLSQGYLYNRRPKSCNVSAESLNSIREEPTTTTQISVPSKSSQLYHCPCGNNCNEKMFCKYFVNDLK